MYEALVMKARDLKRRSRRLRNEGDYAGAEKLLEQAIDLLRPPAEAIRHDTKPNVAAPPDFRELASELADCLGSLGGVLRRHAESLDAATDGDAIDLRLRQALVAYEEGRALEQDDRFRIANSYNLVQSVVLPVIMSPGLIEDPAFRARLAEVRDAIDRQIVTVRSGDPWAYSDRGLVQALLDDGLAADDAWDQLEKLKPERNVYASGLPVLQSLSAALKDNVALREAVRRFQANVDA